jgi:hypothetical protein
MTDQQQQTTCGHWWCQAHKCTRTTNEHEDSADQEDTDR